MNIFWQKKSEAKSKVQKSLHQVQGAGTEEEISADQWVKYHF